MLDFEVLTKQKWAEIESLMVQFIRNEVKNQEKEGILIGISGGIDSAVAAALAVKAVGADKIKGLILPDKDSAPDTLDDAKMVASHLKIEDIQIEDITPKLEAFGTYKIFEDIYTTSREERERLIAGRMKSLNENNALSNGSTLLTYYRENRDDELRKVKAVWTSKVRMRMLTLYFNAELVNYMVLGTTNKTEFKLGWFTKYGDGAVDAEPNFSLYKTRIFEFAEYLGVPEKIIKKVPSADILPGLGDETNIGITYQQIDRILLGLDKELDDEEIAKALALDVDKVMNIKKLMRSAHYNRVVPVNFTINID